MVVFHIVYLVYSWILFLMCLAQLCEAHYIDSQPAITCSKLTIEILEQRGEICSKLAIRPLKTTLMASFGGFIVNLEHISHLCSSVSIVNFEQVNAGWAHCCTVRNVQGILFSMSWTVIRFPHFCINSRENWIWEM